MKRLHKIPILLKIIKYMHKLPKSVHFFYIKHFFFRHICRNFAK